MNTAPPVIGISAYDDVASWGSWHKRAAFVPYDYVGAVAAAGGVPVVLPVHPDGRAQLERVDGVVLSGGPDVDPAHYEAAPHGSTVPASAARDDHELALAQAAEASDLPLLGVCRGLQVLAVARGGRLVQHLPDVVGHTEHGPVPGQHGRHPVRVAAGSRLAQALGSESVTVASHHHQAVDEPGRGLRAVAWAPDGTPEAFEDPGARFVLGVQWHPEVVGDLALFAALVEAAAHR